MFHDIPSRRPWGSPLFKRRLIMTQSNHLISESLPLGRLVAAAMGQLEQLGYSRRSLRRYRTILEHLTEFSRRERLGDTFSEDLAARFNEEPLRKSATLLRSQKSHRGNRTKIFSNGYIHCNTWEVTHAMFQPKTANREQIIMMSHCSQNPLLS